MDNACDVVRDLLPLYVDGVCSDASREMIDGHIGTCSACADVLARLRNSACEDSLRRETANVLAPRRWRNRVFAVSCALAAFLCLPACLVATMGRGPGTDYPLSWLLLLAPSLLVVLAATLLPLRCRRYTGRWTLLGYTASLLLLMMACVLYTTAGAAHVTAEMVLFAAGAVLLYLFSAAVLLPWALKELPLKGRFAGRKVLAAVVWDVTFALLLALCAALALPGRYPAALAVASAALAALTALTVAVLLRGLKMDKLARIGICVTTAGNAAAWLAQTVLRLAGAGENVTRVVQVTMTVLLAAATAAGLALVTAGAWRAYSRVKRSN